MVIDDWVILAVVVLSFVGFVFFDYRISKLEQVVKQMINLELSRLAWKYGKASVEEFIEDMKSGKLYEELGIKQGSESV